MSHIVLTSASELNPKAKVSWLWEPYIPAARITILDGDPGLGKSFVTMDLCARVTAGRPFPGASDDSGVEPRDVLICNCEDERETTMVPRLKAAGATLSRVHFSERVDSGVGNDRIRFLRLPSDKGILLETARAVRPALIVIDPVMSFLDPDIRANSDQSVRTALNCLNFIGEETGAAILLVRHLNKGGGQKAIYRGGGSIGFVGLARSALLIAHNPDFPKQTLLLHAKANMSGKGPSQCFELGFRKGVGTVRWKGQSEITADQALREDLVKTGVEKAMEFLRTFLADGVELPVREILKEGEKVGLSVKNLKMASTRLLVFKRQKAVGARNGHFWSMKRQSKTNEEFLRDLPHA